MNRGGAAAPNVSAEKMSPTRMFSQVCGEPVYVPRLARRRRRVARARRVTPTIRRRDAAETFERRRRARYAKDRTGTPLPWALHEKDIKARHPYFCRVDIP